MAEGRQHSARAAGQGSRQRAGNRARAGTPQAAGAQAGRGQARAAGAPHHRQEARATSHEPRTTRIGHSRSMARHTPQISRRRRTARIIMCHTHGQQGTADRQDKAGRQKERPYRGCAKYNFAGLLTGQVSARTKRGSMDMDIRISDEGHTLDSVSERTGLSVETLKQIIINCNQQKRKDGNNHEKRTNDTRN